MIYQAAGRSGEVAFATYASVRADEYFGGLVFDWSQIKTAKVKFIQMFNHRDGFECDAIHALACYCLAPASAAVTAQEQDFIIFELARLAKASVC